MTEVSFANWLRRKLMHKEIGWTEIGEEFTRFSLFKSRYLNVYLHRLYAPNWNPHGCHDHPWSFLTVLLRAGYLENSGGKKRKRRVGSILYRPASFSHDIITPYGVSWSLVMTGPKSREWSFHTCNS